MSRTKKSRKLGSNGTMRLSKDKLRELRAMKEQRVKKQKGNKPGTRNAIEEPVKNQAKGKQHGKDTRIGSKKPIDLTPQAKATAPKPSKPSFNRDMAPQVQLKASAAPELTPQQELAQIEADERFLELVERHENGELLTGKDAKYFNAKVARHQELCDLLGLDDEDEGDLDDWMSNDLANEWLDDKES